MIETLLIRGQQSSFDVLVGSEQSRAILSGYDYGGGGTEDGRGWMSMSVRARGKDVLAFSRHTY
jgi:hypothetical protein